MDFIKSKFMGLYEARISVALICLIFSFVLRCFLWFPMYEIKRLGNQSTNKNLPQRAGFR